MSQSLRQCINDKCRWCIYDKHAPGNWRQQVMACAIVKCPLWAVRPMSKPKPLLKALKVERVPESGSETDKDPANGYF
jgi:hypothetical protein